MKYYRRLNYDDRKLIENMFNSGVPVDKIAIHLNYNRSSIYYELKHGKKGDKYSADLAQEYALRKQSEKGRSRGLKFDPDLSNYISQLIVREKLSPEKIVERLKKEGYSYPRACNTVYKAIDAGLIPNVTRETLRDRKTHMFSNGLVRIPLWICNEFNLKNNEDLNIDLVDGKIIIEKNN